MIYGIGILSGYVILIYYLVIFNQTIKIRLPKLFTDTAYFSL